MRAASYTRKGTTRVLVKETRSQDTTEHLSVDRDHQFTNRQLNPKQQPSLHSTTSQHSSTTAPRSAAPHRHKMPYLRPIYPRSALKLYIRPSPSLQLLPRTSPATTRTYASKDAPSKDDLNPTSTEYSKSGGDSAAAHTGAAFDPQTTRPEENENGGALDASPGNPEVNRTKEAENQAVGKSRGEAGEESGRSATSVRGSPEKGGST